MTHIRIVTTLIVLLAAVAAAAQPTLFSFEQYSYRDVETGDVTPPSVFGSCGVRFIAEPVAGYLNVAGWYPGLSTEPVWLVHNLYLHDLTYGVVEDNVSYQFPLDELGIEEGMTAPMIFYGWEVTPGPLYDDDAAAWIAGLSMNQSAPTELVEVGVGDAAENPEEEFVDGDPGIMHSVAEAGGEDEVFSHPFCDVPNLDLDGSSDAMDVAACFPAACSNSLKWLAKNSDDITIPDDGRSIMKQLGKLAQRTSPRGVMPKDMVRAKLDYIEAHRLPIKVKVQDISSEGPYGSSSGNTSCEDKDGASTQWPTLAHIQQEAKDGEDVEVQVSWYYLDTDGKLKPSNYSHSLVLSGAGVTGGGAWITLKDDGDQHNPDSDLTDNKGVRQRTSGTNTTGGTVRVPGANVTIPAGPGAGKEGIALVSSVVSESESEEVTHPPAEETFGKYCQFLKRTIPAGATITYAYPDTGSRCYNTTLTIRDPLGGHDIRLGPWNRNKAGQNTYTNNRSYPIVVMLHNDDKAGGQTPYPPYNVTSTVTAAFKSAEKADTPFNPEDYGGYSLGGTDSSSAEFGQGLVQDVMSLNVPDFDFDLSLFPARLANAGAVRLLHLFHSVIQWNEYWEHLGVVVDVAEVTSPGQLFVDCPASGTQVVFTITAPGRYEADLGMLAPSEPELELILEAQGGLDVTLDCLGVPSLTPFNPTGVEPETPPRMLAVLEARPNPFNPLLEVFFAVPRDGDVLVSVHDLRGRLVDVLHEGPLAAAEHRAVWDGVAADGRAAPSGAYLVRVEQAGVTVSHKVVLAR